jgi:DNA repair exonuclease SbcCD ATPase subunit
MDLEQIIKRLDWLDEERRKDKILIATLEERINRAEAQVPPVAQQVKEVDSELTRLSSSLARFDSIDAAIAQIRVDYSRAIEAVEKQRLDHEREAEKMRRADMESLSKTIADVRKGLDPIPELKVKIQARVEEEYRLGRLIEEVDHKLTESNRGDEEYKRTLKLLDEGRRQDSKRLTDIQSEVSAFRKRLDEQRGKVDLAADIVRKLELRLSEIQASESERRQNQANFIEKQNMLTVERERVWKEWQPRFEDITRQAVNLDGQMQSLEATHRAVKRSQEAFDEITQRFERRVNEITEMQRLTEERFRQEWVTFKADDQKRWTNYTLTQEEQQRESTRQFEKLVERLVNLEDSTQEVSDLLQEIINDTQTRLQALRIAFNDTVEEFERSFGHTR